ncbi:MAG: translation factor GTPase family protein [Lentihominibacter sp.]|nr:translation factor GTPase family protein [Lentihominibacter sp.]
MTERKKLTTGILAHVDAGKTTLSEAMLYRTGVIDKPGRVDRGNAFMDSAEQERKRGITIFFGQAELPLEETDLTLLDTPGHVDFSSETERVLGVLDCAVLVVSGRDGVQGHTVTLWRLLRRLNIPAVIFVNKMDIAVAGRDELMENLKENLGEGCFAAGPDGLPENGELEDVAAADEVLLEEYLDKGKITFESLSRAVGDGAVYPCFFGSALKFEGIDEFLRGFESFMKAVPLRMPAADIWGDDFRCKVFKITRDSRGDKLVHVKVTEGTLKVRDSVASGDGEAGRINQIRVYSGDRYRQTGEASEGMICTLTGVSGVVPGEGDLKPVLSYSVIIPEDVNPHDALMKFRELEEEDPGLHVTWDEEHEEIQVSLMGPVQMEILRGMVHDRFGFSVDFGEEKISYRETVAGPVQGAGHFEPLRHYAEVHLLMEPLEPGSGIRIGSLCSEDELDRNWQRLIMTHLAEKEFTGPLTGSSITDMKISVLGGRAHGKHTEGGDFRQATYRAVAQGLRKSLRDGEIILLEPWYDFRLEVPAEYVGKAMGDIQRMGGETGEPVQAPGGVILEGSAPVAELKDYTTQLRSYSGGRGRIFCEYAGYYPCHNSDEVAETIGYDADGDSSVHSDSIFCVRGAGRSVPWDESDELMHVSCRLPGEADIVPPVETGPSSGSGAGTSGNDEENLKRIFERNLSANRRSGEKKPRIAAREVEAPVKRRKKPAGESLPEHLFVDGYNIIFAWEELRDLAKVNIDSAADALVEIMGNYRGYRNCPVTVVFDAYRVKGGQRRREDRNGVEVVFTGEDETADTCIERTTFNMRGKCRVRVATSDRLERSIVLGNDGVCVSATGFRKEVELVEDSIQEAIERNNRRNMLEHKNTIEIREDWNENEKNL